MNIDRRLINIAKLYWPFWALAVVLGAAAGGLAAVQAGLLSRIINRVFLASASLQEVAGLLSGLLAALVARFLLTWGSEAAGNGLARRAKEHLRRRLAEQVLRLGPLVIQGERTGELHSLALEGIDAVEAYFSQYLSGLALAAIVPLTLLALVFPLDPLSGVVLLLTGPLIPLFMALIGGWAQRLTERQFTSLGRMSAYFLDVIQGLTTLKTFGRSKAQTQGIRQAGQSYRKATMGVLRVTFLSALTLEMLATISTAIVAVEVGLRLLYGRMAFEPAFFILVLAPEYYAPLRSLGARFHAGMAGVTAARRLFNVLESEGPVPAAGEGEAFQLDGPPQIRFEDVAFAYPGSDYAAIEGVKLHLKPGQPVTLRGPSGSGKSTTAALLLGLARPTRGRILVNECDLAGIPAAEWQRCVAWAPQRPALFYGTVLENLRMARPEAALEQVQAAASMAEADTFIQALPQAYDTLIGERGVRLSAGQAQRLSLARAFLRDAPLVVLDEPTAHLDPDNAAAIQRAITRLVQGRTALIISHQRENPAEAATSTTTPAPISLQARDSDGKATGSRQVGVAGRQEENKDLSTVMHLLSLMRPFWPLALLAMVAGAATTLSSVGLMAASAYILSAAALHPSVAVLQTAIVGVRFFGISRGLFRYAERYLSHDATFRLLAEIRSSFYERLEPLAPAGLAWQRSGDLLNRMVGDIAGLENFYVRAVGPSGAALLTASVVSLWLGSYAPQLGWSWLGWFALAGVAAPWAARQMGGGPGKRSVESRSELSAAWVEGVQSLAELTVFGQGPRWVEQICRQGRRLSAAQQALGNLAALQSALTPALGWMSLWAVLRLAIPLVVQGQVEGVMLAGLALAALAGFEAATPLPLAGQYWESSLRSAKRLFDVTAAVNGGNGFNGRQTGSGAGEAVPWADQGAVNGKNGFNGVRSNTVAGKTGALVDEGAVNGKNGFNGEGTGLRAGKEGAYGNERQESMTLEIAGVDFTYPGETQPVLRGFRLRLAAGERLALTGPSGIGKSTLVGLLLGFWTPQAGDILVNGNPIQNWPEEALRDQLSVMQGDYLFSATVADNLRLGHPKATVEEMEQAARWAGIHERILRLPQGYQTWIGEGGAQFSGGERQRLALARALLRPAPLLILDEPTAYLDDETALQVREGILQASQGRSLLVITHDKELFSPKIPCVDFWGKGALE